MTDTEPQGIDAVIELLTRLATGDYAARGAPMNADDELDAVIVGINMLAEELGAHREELEERVRQRTVELEAARAQAVEASRVKSEFLASMSHEIRTPMNGVMGLATLLQGTPLDATQQQYVGSLQNAGDALLTVINDVLDFSKLEAGRVELEQEDVDPGGLVEGVADLLAAEAARKELELVTSCAPDVPRLLVGDAGRLRQILLNLASNAVKFTDKGEVVISVKLRGEDAGRPRVRFEVADTGIGVPRAARERLFESFTQADASTTRKYGGTGLGLAISRELCTVMGGDIGVHSQEGAGSTFWFEVPLHVSTTPAPALEPDGLHGQRILVVDDNASCRRALESQLSTWGMRPEPAEHLGSVVETMREAAAAGVPYAVALVDALMPDRDGLELAGRIAADPSLTSTAVVVLLSPTGKLDQDKLEAAGAAATLSKPVRRTDLADCLRDLVAGSEATDDAGDSGARETTAGPGSGTVLVVEDNPVNQLVAEGMVNSLGYDVHVVGHGVTAVEAVAATDYVAVLMDCQMPLMDGCEATARIRQLEAETQAVRVPVIAMTASATEENRQRCLEAGMDDYVSKPIRLDLLTEVLHRWARR